ncbi:MAG: hypothetical protein RLZZ490_214, partial [Cyanobacteriota bacterium]
GGGGGAHGKKLYGVRGPDNITRFILNIFDLKIPSLHRTAVYLCHHYCRFADFS